MKHYLSIMVLLILSTSVFSNEMVTWTNGNTEHSYELVYYYGISWDEANSSVEEDWHLATITSEAEQNFITTNVTNYAYGEFWLGGTQDENATSLDEGWAWNTGEDFYSYTNWAESEPNDWPDNVEDGYENHLAMWSEYGWKWNDEHTCGNIHGYVVEKTTSVPEPNTMFLLVSGFFGILGFVGLKRKK